MTRQSPEVIRSRHQAAELLHPLLDELYGLACTATPIGGDIYNLGGSTEPQVVVYDIDMGEDGRYLYTAHRNSDGTPLEGLSRSSQIQKTTYEQTGKIDEFGNPVLTQNSLIVSGIEKVVEAILAVETPRVDVPRNLRFAIAYAQFMVKYRLNP